jgi:hypothetical protein
MFPENFYLFDLKTLGGQFADTTTVIKGLCDSSGVPDTRKVNALIAAHQDTAAHMKPMAVAQMNGAASLYLYNRDPALRTLPSPQDVSKLRQLIAVGSNQDASRISIAMDPVESGKEYLFLFRPPSSTWVVAHALSMPMGHYISDLLDRGPVPGQRAQLRRIEMRDGTCFLVRSFFDFEDKVEVMVTMYEKPPGKPPVAVHMPEDRFTYLSEPFPLWLDKQKKKLGCGLKSDTSIGKTSSAALWRDLIPAGACYFTINKSDVYSLKNGVTTKREDHPISGEYLQTESFRLQDGAVVKLAVEQLTTRSVLERIMAKHGGKLSLIARPVVEEGPPIPTKQPSIFARIFGL